MGISLLYYCTDGSIYNVDRTFLIFSGKSVVLRRIDLFRVIYRQIKSFW